MDWLRWHHGTVDEAKLRTAAKRAGARMCEAVAMWAICMEAASRSEPRGSCAALDFEVIDCTQDFDEGTAARLYAAFQGLARPLIGADGNLLAWEKRQPKREREDDTAAERKRRQRERQREAGVNEGRCPTREEGEPEADTPCHAMSHQKTPRGEEIRLDTGNVSSSLPPPAADARTRPVIVDMAIALNSAGFRCTARNPDLIAYEAEGGDLDHLKAIAADPACSGKAAGYVLKFARRELATKPGEVVVQQGVALTVAAGGRDAAPSRRMQAVVSLEKFK